MYTITVKVNDDVFVRIRFTCTYSCNNTPQFSLFALTQFSEPFFSVTSQCGEPVQYCGELEPKK